MATASIPCDSVSPIGLVFVEVAGEVRGANVPRSSGSRPSLDPVSVKRLDVSFVWAKPERWAN